MRCWTPSHHQASPTDNSPADTRMHMHRIDVLRMATRQQRVAMQSRQPALKQTYLLNTLGQGYLAHKKAHPTICSYAEAYCRVRGLLWVVPD